MNTEREFRRALARERRRGSAGVFAGIFGCIFALLGMFTIGILFLPLAAIFSAAGLAAGAVRLNGTGILVSAVGLFLAVIGAVVSPSVIGILAISAGR